MKFKLFQYLPSILVMLTVLAANFPAIWLYIAAMISTGFIMLSLVRKWLRATPRVPKVSFFLPFIFLVGVFGTAAASPAAGFIFGLIASYLLFHFYLLFPQNQPPFVGQTLLMFTAFMYSAFVWSLNYFFTPPAWVVMGLLGSGYLALFWPKLPRIGSWVGTLVISELAWVLLFWPLHFFSVAVVLLGAFYLIYTLSDLYISEKLTRRLAIFQISLISFVIIVVLISSAWQPINRL